MMSARLIPRSWGGGRRAISLGGAAGLANAVASLFENGAGCSVAGSEARGADEEFCRLGSATQPIKAPVSKNADKHLIHPRIRARLCRALAPGFMMGLLWAVRGAGIGALAGDAEMGAAVGGTAGAVVDIFGR